MKTKSKSQPRTENCSYLYNTPNGSFILHEQLYEFCEKYFDFFSLPEHINAANNVISYFQRSVRIPIAYVIIIYQVMISNRNFNLN